MRASVKYMILPLGLLAFFYGITGALAGQLRDPFLRPDGVRLRQAAPTPAPGRHVVQAPNKTLRATLVGKEPMADIDGVVVGLGDEIDGYKVVSISEQRVSLLKDGHTVTLELASPPPEAVQ